MESVNILLQPRFIIPTCDGGTGADPGGGQGGLSPPSPQKIASPNSQARIQALLPPPPPGGARGPSPPPYKILDPPMRYIMFLHKTPVMEIVYHGVATRPAFVTGGEMSVEQKPGSFLTPGSVVKSVVVCSFGGRRTQVSEHR